MDVDKAIEFLLLQGARLDARQQRFDEQLRRMALLGERAYRRLSRSQHELSEAQRRTEQTVQLVAERQKEMQGGMKDMQASLHSLMHVVERHIGGGGA